MVVKEKAPLQAAFEGFIGEKGFPCTGAKAALGKEQVYSMVAGHMACPAHDKEILAFLYDFLQTYRESGTGFHSGVILFTSPVDSTEDIFEKLMWSRLQALANLDAENYSYDSRVSADPFDPAFSFSLMEEACFVIGLHPNSSRPARRFYTPALVFNPHAQFAEFRQTNKYSMMQQSVRKRDVQFSGSVNPMLTDFGTASEAMQYSGKFYADGLTCPLQFAHKNV